MKAAAHKLSSFQICLCEVDINKCVQEKKKNVPTNHDSKEKLVPGFP